MTDSSQSIYLILGGAGGIGSEVCRRLSRAGNLVTIAGRNMDKLRSVADETGAACEVVDATDWEAVEALGNKVLEQQGRLDGIVNCVGSICLKPAHLTSKADFQQVLDTNLGSSFAVIRTAARTMRKSGGSVVLLSSAAARIGMPNHEAIAAAKSALIGLALSAAATYARSRIRINVVAPGMVRSPLSAPILANPNAEKASLSMHPLGRLGEPSDIASMIVWLLQPENNWVTGQVFGIDGGLSSLHTP